MRALSSSSFAVPAGFLDCGNLWSCVEHARLAMSGRRQQHLKQVYLRRSRDPLPADIMMALRVRELGFDRLQVRPGKALEEIVHVLALKVAARSVIGIGQA